MKQKTSNLFNKIARYSLIGFLAIFPTIKSEANCVVYFLDSSPGMRGMGVEDKYLFDLSQNPALVSSLKKRGYIGSNKLASYERSRLSHLSDHDIILIPQDINFADFGFDKSSIGKKSTINFKLIGVHKDLNPENGFQLSGITSSRVEAGEWTSNLTSAIGQTKDELNKMGWAALGAIGHLRKYKSEFVLNNLSEDVISEILSALPRCSVGNSNYGSTEERDNSLPSSAF
jgi:hypothetical protein